MKKKYLLILLLAFLAVCAIAQPVTITPPSANIQPGESVTLTASGALYYQWSPDTGLSTTEGPVTVASPTVTTTYTCSGYAPGDESVVNSNFDQGNVGFTSDYTFSDNLYPEGTYGVGSNARAFHPDFIGTGHGDSGNFMIVNGSTSPNTNVWTEQITVVPNTYYAFSTWVCTVSAAGDVARLQFSINGNQLGAVFSAPPYTDQWLQFYELWYSENNTAATITILNQNTSGSGNDFGLDDISFCELVLVGAPQCTVSVGSMSTSATADDTELCEGESTTLHALPVDGSGNYTYSWTPANTLDNPTSQHPVATPFAGSTTYTCQITDVGWNNTAEVSVGVTVYAQPIADAGEDQIIPYGSSAQLEGSGGGSGFTYQWKPGNMVIDSTAQNTQTVVLTSHQTYTLIVTNPRGQCIDSTQVTVFIEGGALAATISADPTWLCEGESTQLTATALYGTHNYTYSWTPTTGLSNPSIYNPVATPAETTTYTCEISDGQTNQTVRTEITVYHNDFGGTYTIDKDHYPYYQCDSIPFFWFGDTTYFKEKGDYLFSSVPDPDAYIVNPNAVTEHGCDTATLVTVPNMEYSPRPAKIECQDAIMFGIPEDDDPTNDTAMFVAVVTNTEFFSFQYTFRVKESKHNKDECLWNSCKWSINNPSWAIDTTGVQIPNDTCYSDCTVYVAERNDDYVILTATAKNGCDSIQHKIYLKSSFLDIDEQNIIQSEFTVVPNPNNGQMKLVFNRFEGKVEVKVYDVMGNLMDSFVTYNDSGTTIFEYDMNGLKGLYFIVANGREGTIAKKVVIQ